MLPHSASYASLLVHMAASIEFPFFENVGPNQWISLQWLGMTFSVVFVTLYTLEHPQWLTHGIKSEAYGLLGRSCLLQWASQSAARELGS